MWGVGRMVWGEGVGCGGVGCGAVVGRVCGGREALEVHLVQINALNVLSPTHCVLQLLYSMYML